MLDIQQWVHKLSEVPYMWQGALGVGFLLWLWSDQRNKVNLPKYGGILSFSSILSKIKISIEGFGPYQNAYTKYPMIQMPELDGWKIMVHTRFLDEMIRAPEDVLSFHEATFDSLQAQYTFGKPIVDNLWHNAAIRNHLTRNLGPVLPGVHDEIEMALQETVGSRGNEWTEVNAFKWLQHIVSRAANRIFVGEPLCRDKAWIDLMQNGPEVVMAASVLIGLFPKPLQGIVGPLVSPADGRTKRAAKMLRPYFEERLQMDESQRPRDMISWLLQIAPEGESDLESIASRISVINFAAIHTSGLSITHAVYWLVARPEYLPPLREEIQSIIDQYGWSKDSIAKMVKLDSFLKESARISPLATQVIGRKVLKPFTFSNGFTAPVGSNLVCHLYAMHHDESIYHDADEFNPFRWLETNPGREDQREEDGDEKKETMETRKTMYTTSKTYLPFGHGKNACPGRFFAALELKAVLASLILGYELKWPDDVSKEAGGRYRPADIWVGGNLVPNPRAKLLIRKRVV
ncbi:putative cycloheximide-inducible protein CIP70 [Serendipita vermifera]|nr:putative cycloheximide-inducible protein CIP70 [Serendipita vermifera]